MQERELNEKSKKMSSLGLQSEPTMLPPNKASKNRQQGKSLIKEILLREIDGREVCEPKKTTQSSLRFLHAANFEIGIIEKEYKKLSQLEKNRIFLKFIDMNDSPHKYKHYEHFKDKKQRRVKLNLSKEELSKMYEKEQRYQRGRNLKKEQTYDEGGLLPNLNETWNQMSGEYS